MRKMPLLRFKLVFILIMVYCFSHNGFSQQANIVPPTPNAMKMTEYYAQRPNMYTGTANVSIPLHTIDFDGWQLPLSISYNATGIRTNEEAGEVGLGWALNATGVISRTIRGSDDLFQGIASGPKGYVYNDYPIPINFDLGYAYNDPSVPTVPAVPPSTSYYHVLISSNPDTQPDIFYYNFFGYSGSFVLSQINDPLSPGVVNVIKITKDACIVSFDKSGKNFTVITPDGYKGDFTVKELSTTFSSYPTSNTIANNTCWGENYIDIQGIKNQGRFKTISSWYLNKITSPRGQIIRFVYALRPDGSSLYISNTRSKGEFEDINSPPVVMQTVHEHVYLDSIISDEIKISFAREIREDLRANSLFTLSTHDFKYSTDIDILNRPMLPQRYGSINIRAIDPVSTLNKSITFRQSYFNQQYQDLISGSQSENELEWLRGRLDRVIIDDQEYRFYYEKGYVGLPYKLTNGIDHFGFYNGHDNITMLLPPEFVSGAISGCVFNPSNTSVTTYYRQLSNRLVNFNYGKAGLLTKVQYPSRGHTIYEYEPHTYWPETTGAFLEYTGETQAGGARIKSIKDYDSDTLILSKSYQYIQTANIVQPFTFAVSTGKLMAPLYNRFVQYARDANNNMVVSRCNFVYRTNSSIPGNNSAEGKVIGYSKVHEIVEGNAAYKNTYFFENTPNTVLAAAVAIGYPNLNGQVKEIRNYNSTGNVIQWTQNIDRYHVIDSTGIKGIVYGYNNFDPLGFGYLAKYYTVQTFITPFKVLSTTLDQQATSSEDSNGNLSIIGGALQTEKTFNYSGYNYLLSSEQVKTGMGDSILTLYSRPFDYLSPSAAVQQMKSSNMVNPVIEEITYKNGGIVSAHGNQYVYDGVHNKINLTATYSYNQNLPGTFQTSTDGNAFASPYEQKTNFTSYDATSGKLQEYTASDGVTQSFLWGYNKKLPIVHGVGIGYNQLLTAYNNAAGNSATYESTLRNDPTVLGKQVTTYFHNPQIGLSKVTDPSGVKKTFEYDQYGRLQIVRDNSGYVLHQNKYHFKTLPATRVLTLSTTAIDFGAFYHCNLPAPATLTVSNTGEDDLQVNYMSVPTGFTSTWPGGIIYAGTSIDIPISFIGSPSANAYYGTITFDAPSKTAGSVSTATINAMYKATDGVTKTIQLTPNPINVPGIHQWYSVTVANVGQECLNIFGTTSLAADDQDWAATIPPIILAPTQSTTLSVFLKVSSPQGHSITVNSDKNGGTDILTVDIQKIILSPSSYSISSSATTATIIQTFTVTNTGNTLLSVSGITCPDSHFAVSPASFSLASGATPQTVTVTYVATDFNPKSTVLTFNSNATTLPGTVTVNAQRTQLYQFSFTTPTPPVTPTASVSVKPSIPTVSSYLYNTGNVPAIINSVTPIPPAGFVVTYWVNSGTRVQVNPNTSPVTLQPGDRLEAQVSAANNDYTFGSGSVTIFDGNSTQYTISLTKSTGQ